MTDYAFILTTNYPGMDWSLNGDDYEGLEWKGSIPKPSKETLDQEYAEYMEKFSYIKKRENAYNERGATIQNISVALWKRMIEDNPTPSDELQIIRQGVQSDIPKPIE